MIKVSQGPVYLGSAAPLDVVAEKTYIPLSQKATANGVATLDGNTQVPLAQLPVDDTLSSVSENPVQNKVVTSAINANADAISAINDELGTNPPWQKPSDWLDIRNGALDNSLYFLVGHSADYVTYPQFSMYAKISNSGTYDVYVDGVKQATTASNSNTVLAWQTLALTSGFDTTHPAALRTHVVRVTPTVSTNTITDFHLVANTSVDQGVLWMHSTLNNAINFSNLFSDSSGNYKCLVLEAVTSSTGEIKANISNAFSNSSVLAEVPVISGEDVSIPGSGILKSAFNNCSSIKSVKLKNILTSELNSTFNKCSSLKRIECENVSALSLVNYAYNGCSVLKNTLSISEYGAAQANNFSGCSALYPFMLDLSTVSTLQYFRIGASSSNRLDNLKAVIFNTSMTFTNASNTINVSYTGLDRVALVNMFTSLPTVTGSPVCNITGATGADSLDATDLAIAGNKGWTVTR